MKKAELKKTLKALSTAELQERLTAESIDHAVSPVDNSADLRRQRRELAQIKTILRERELSNN